MAQVKYGGGIVQMSGSIAGNTFARNRYGNYVRAKSKPVNPNTSRQSSIRNTVSALTEAWNETLTQVQRDAWNLYADSVAMTNKLGETIHLSGFNHYVRSNSIRLFAGAATRIDAGPTVFSLPEVDPVFTVVGNNDNTIDIVFDATMDWIDLDDAHMMVFLGRPQSAGRNFFAGPWRYVTRLDGDAITPITSPEAAVAVPFAITPGQKIWAYARISYDDGRLSTKFQVGPIIVTA